MKRFKHQIIAYLSRKSSKCDGLEIFQPSCKIFIFKISKYHIIDFCMIGKEPNKITNKYTTKIELKQKVNRIGTLEAMSHDVGLVCSNTSWNF